MLPLFPLAVLVELCSREIGFMQAARDAWTSWVLHFAVTPNYPLCSPRSIRFRPSTS